MSQQCSCKPPVPKQPRDFRLSGYAAGNDTKHENNCSSGIRSLTQSMSIACVCRGLPNKADAAHEPQLQSTGSANGWKRKQAYLLGRGRLGSSVEFPAPECVTADTAELAAAWNERTADAAAEVFAAAMDAFSKDGCCADVLSEAFDPPAAGASAGAPGASAAAAGATTGAASEAVAIPILTI